LPFNFGFSFVLTLFGFQLSLLVLLSRSNCVVVDSRS